MNNMTYSTLYNRRNTDPDLQNSPWGWIDWHKGEVSKIAYEEEPYFWVHGFAMSDMIEWLKAMQAPAHIFEELKCFDMVEVELTIKGPVPEKPIN